MPKRRTKRGPDIAVEQTPRGRMMYGVTQPDLQAIRANVKKRQRNRR